MTKRLRCLFKDIEFGTAGMRGLLERETGRVNVYTILKQRLHFGHILVNHLMMPQQRESSIAMIIAINLAILRLIVRKPIKNGINTFILMLETHRIIFMLFAIRLSSGIMITASHNPKSTTALKSMMKMGRN